MEFLHHQWDIDINKFNERRTAALLAPEAVVVESENVKLALASKVRYDASSAALLAFRVF